MRRLFKPAFWSAWGILMASGFGQLTQLGFDVASIRRSQPGIQTILSHYPGGRFVAEKATLKTLISSAYQVNNREILAGPKWIDTDRFDVEAKAGEASVSALSGSADENLKGIRVMLRELLASRFGLQIRIEDRDLLCMNSSWRKRVRQKAWLRMTGRSLSPSPTMLLLLTESWGK